MYGAVILAAGASTRMGAPKPLLKIQGEPAVARVARVAKEAGCDRVVVVVGAEADRVRAAVPPPANVLVNPRWDVGRTGSLKLGLSSLPASCCSLVWPVDHPGVAASTVRALLDGDEPIRVPTHAGRRGHPTLFHADLTQEILALEDDQPLHDVLHARPERVAEVPVNDEAILLNVDTPMDLTRLESHLGRMARARSPP